MKRIFQSALAFGLFFSLFCLPAGAEEASRFVLAGKSLRELKARATRYGGRMEHELHQQRATIMLLTKSAAAKLRREFPGHLIEEDGEVHILGRIHRLGKPSGGAQPAQSVPWGIRAVHAPEAWAYSRGAGVTVCVVDTGVQKSHPDLAANIAGGKNFVAIRGVIDPNRYDDDNGHGTHVSGTIAALDNTIGVVGVAPQAKIYAVKVLDRRGSGYMSAVADGIRACVDAGVKVINMSLGGSSDSTLVKDAVVYAAAAGVTIMAAAGNESGTVSYPAKYPEVFAISAVDENLQFAYFSNFGPEVDYAAPGVAVQSTVTGNSYASYSGTSMASPHAAGVAALMHASAKTQIQADDIGFLLDQQGFGLVNALKTVMP